MPKDESMPEEEFLGSQLVVLKTSRDAASTLPEQASGRLLPEEEFLGSQLVVLKKSRDAASTLPEQASGRLCTPALWSTSICSSTLASWSTSSCSSTLHRGSCRQASVPPSPLHSRFILRLMHTNKHIIQTRLTQVLTIIMNNERSPIRFL
ncbi:hypothetical protein SNE40_002572 [Patella caerulea]|uniref:Uncharacterized protein n=1 Tax=Patella caerulea TaxID=87958 RepID=A0AAN8K8Q1_PATCE